MKPHREITAVYPYYMNPGMLQEQRRVWASYPDYLKSRLHVVVVDDCSPDHLSAQASAINVDGLASVRVYRLMEKKRWNWPACRNLGAAVATTEWLLLSDIDHVLPAETLDVLLHEKWRTNDAFRFKRKTVVKPWPYQLSQCTPYKSHNDTWFMTRDLFYFDNGQKFVGGYDERLSGCYGSSGEFRDRVFACARAVKELEQVVLRYPREVLPDASTHPSVYTRKGDPENDAELKRRKEERATIEGWRPLRGLIRHEEVFSPMVTA